MITYYKATKHWKLVILALSLLIGSPGYGQVNRQKLPAQTPESTLAAARSATTVEAYNKAVQDFIVVLQRHYPVAYWGAPFMIGPYRVSVSSPSTDSALWDPLFFDTYVPANSVPRRYLRKSIKTTGQGVPFVGVRQATAERMSADPFLPESGMTGPVTMLLEFTYPSQAGGGIDVKIDVVNPRRSDAVLAADYTAPLELLATQARSDHFILQGLLRPLESSSITGLYMLEPYQKDKIPVVMVHGLDSSPRTWVNTYNELMSDPVVRKHYQFWLFRYPTGNPVLYSAAQLREDLQQVRAYHDPGLKDKPFDNMIVVGHSMGGLLTRLLVTESGNAFWRANSNIRFEDATLAPGDREVLQKNLFFHRLPFVKRVVFIATPHRGSDLASGSVGKAVNKMISMPLEVTGITQQASLHPNGVADRLNNLKIVTGIDNLKPTNPMVKALQLQPIYAPYHSIVGNHGVTWHGVPDSDGVVPYESSHLEGAESEVVVPSNHSAHLHPVAIKELGRILRLHLLQNSN